MADLSDVETALKRVIVDAIYPSGVSAPSAMRAATGTPIPARVVRGWPNKLQLKSDLAAGIVTISITPAGVDRDVTRYGPQWSADRGRAAADRTPMGVALSSSSGAGAPDTVSWSGVASCPQNVSVTVDGRVYRTGLTAGATAADAATALATLIAPDRPVAISGGVMTFVGAYGLRAAAGAIVARGLVREIARFERGFQVALWCNSPEQRDAAARFIADRMSGAGAPVGGLDHIDVVETVQATPLITSTSKARVSYVSRNVSDDPEMIGLFRANFVYTLEYGQFEWSDGAAIVSLEAEFTPHSSARSFDPNTTPAPEPLIETPIIVHI